ncbi:BMP family ABC transporter substrate-binding protein [Lachnobacterium bovis]|uniref:BMP family ABC transporter substrate-binding protein n=1 Tax=Lachnobacterium bovis TaxID=140626 RepID=UPI0003B489DB|nr:BMP family ABC transporter substrate-binding protein [Lachnobacterium bovis]
MGAAEYQEALKLGKKEYRTRSSSGDFPYLPVLDELISNENIQTDQYLGLVNIPLEKVVGTSTAGRTQAFAANFMPLLEYGSEFSLKWSSLSEAQLNEGIRDPIECYEYMNKYYVVEGNKRVSVMKFFEAVSIPAIVTRKIPKYSEDKNVKVYYEYMHFTDVTRINTIDFSKEGMSTKILELVGEKEPWSDDAREEFKRVLFDFSRAFEGHNIKNLKLELGDALAVFMSIFTYEEMKNMTEDDYDRNIIKSWNEFLSVESGRKIDIILDPTENNSKKGLLSYFMPQNNQKLKVAFLYPRAPETSDWIYAHELGRQYLEEKFPDKIDTISVYDVKPNNVESILDDVIAEGTNIIFGVAPEMMRSSLKAAIEHPNVKILNCSLNAPHRYIRTYYARMYEAKYIAGMIAGAMTDNNKIAYIADYPIYGTTANINAFALGALCVNPRAKVYLEWSSRKGYDIDNFLKENDLRYVSNQDMITPRHASREFGVYQIENGKTVNLLVPIWNWGMFYEKMIESILEGNYQSQETKTQKALNYWWGMSSGAIDIVMSKNVPYRVALLAEHIKKDIIKGEATPFYGEIYAQDGRQINKANKEMRPEDIMKMDYLVENIVGHIPDKSELIDKAQNVVKIQGVE